MLKKLSLAIIIASSTAGSSLALDVPRISFNQLVKSDIEDPTMNIYRAELASSIGDFDTAASNYITAMRMQFLDVTGNLIDLISQKKLSPEVAFMGVKELERLAGDNPDLSKYIGDFYNEPTINQNKRDAFFWYHNAMRLGDKDIVKTIADFVVEKQGGANEIYSEIDALSMYRSYVDRHKTPDIAFDIAEKLYDGEKIERNLTLAHKYYTLAAEGNINDAYFRLAYMNEKGIGAPVNIESAVEYYHKAQGTKHSTEALYRLARIHMYSEGAFSEPVKGYSFLKKAADRGHLDALYKVGLMHFYGTDFVNVDTDMAVTYFEKASQLGSKMATLKLIDIYTNGAAGIKPSSAMVSELVKRQK